MGQERFSLKDALFNAGKVAYLAKQFGAADARFDAVGFERDVMAEMLPLELKARMQLIARVLAAYLPDDFADAAAVIERALPAELDPTRSVTRSVANHLNDIAKVDGALVIETLTRWRELERQDAKELESMKCHALRTLVKQGDPAAMALLGYVPDPPIEVGPIVLGASQVAIGDVLSFEVAIKATGPAQLLVDYAVEFVKADGTRKPKVFKLKQVTMGAGWRVD